MPLVLLGHKGLVDGRPQAPAHPRDRDRRSETSFLRGSLFVRLRTQPASAFNRTTAAAVTSGRDVRLIRHVVLQWQACGQRDRTARAWPRRAPVTRPLRNKRPRPTIPQYSLQPSS